MGEKDTNIHLSPEEQQFVKRVSAQYTPPPLTFSQQVRFDRTLEERLTRRTSLITLRPAAMLTAVAAAVLIFLTMPDQPGQTPSNPQQTEVTELNEDTPLLEKDDTLLSYAYYGPNFYDEDAEEDNDTTLSEEYDDLVSAFTSPDA